MKETYKCIADYLSDEKEEINRDLQILEKTEGYSSLSVRQKQIIRVSLAVQARANREGVTNYCVNKGIIRRVRRFLNRTSEETRYQASGRHVIRWYCHGAIASLEGEDFEGEWPKDNPIEFFNASYFEVASEYDVKKAIEYYGFPSVVHVNEASDNLEGEDSQYHSFLALGHNEDGEIVVWHKEGFRYPYKVTTLHSVYEVYGPSYFWGVRKLKNATSETELEPSI